jgi:hypothetical protein
MIQSFIDPIAQDVHLGPESLMASLPYCGTTYKPVDFEEVYKVDGAPQHIMGMRDIEIKT